ncbi:serine hydrolase domain-containing protein [Demequina sp.]|uniref:serine hydrolase domain-containing protein n=1 Tax=Demequina sp. TaxID=2050685 RepID=UPI003D118EA6
MSLPDAVAEAVGKVADGFTGVAVVSQGDEVLFSQCSGLANRAYGVPFVETTRFGVASGSKTFTAVIVLRLMERGLLSLSTPVREWLGEDLPLIAPEVTLEHLLTHTSGIGDYLDEEELEPDAYVLTRPVHEYLTSEDFLPTLEGFPQVSAPGEKFVYNNGGFVVAGIIAERVTGVSYAELVRTEVVEPAGMVETGMLRTDSLPGDVAVGYVESEGLRSNVLHMPLIGPGDGCAISSVADSARFWDALLGGALVSPESLELMTTPRPGHEAEGMRYGLGMWRHITGPALIMEGCDVGVSFRSTRDAETGLTATVYSNTWDGGWDMINALNELF